MRYGIAAIVETQASGGVEKYGEDVCASDVVEIHEESRRYQFAYYAAAIIAGLSGNDVGGVVSMIFLRSLRRVDGQLARSIS
jgi:hypothetical protein